jgi:hypothetical protein
MIDFAIATVILLATASALLFVPNQASAQITPSTSSVNELGFMAQNTTDPVQNNTAANVTQLATVLPTVEPIAPTAFAPVIEESDESMSSSDNDDSNSDNNDDDSNSDNNDDDDGDDDDDDDDDDDSGRSAIAGGAFASAG